MWKKKCICLNSYISFQLLPFYADIVCPLSPTRFSSDLILSVTRSGSYKTQELLTTSEHMDSSLCLIGSVISRLCCFVCFVCLFFVFVVVFVFVFVFVFFCLRSVSYAMLPVSLDCSFRIVPSFFCTATI